MVVLVRTFKLLIISMLGAMHTSTVLRFYFGWSYVRAWSLGAHRFSDRRDPQWTNYVPALLSRAFFRSSCPLRYSFTHKRSYAVILTVFLSH